MLHQCFNINIKSRGYKCGNIKQTCEHKKTIYLTKYPVLCLKSKFHIPRLEL